MLGSKSSQPPIVATTRSDMTELNTALVNYTFDNFTSIKNEFEALGYSLIATPTFGSLAESMPGSANITTLGQFSLDEFDCRDNPILITTGFNNSILNGYPYMLFAGFDQNGFRGTAAQIYRDYRGEDKDLRDFFYPNEERGLFAFVLNEDGSTVEDDSNTTSTTFSAPGANQPGQNPGINGYYRTNQFSDDDGVWGFRSGSGLSGNGGGPYLSGDPSSSYGAENACSGDSSANDFYWGEEVRTSQYAFYFAVKRVGNICNTSLAPLFVEEADVDNTVQIDPATGKDVQAPVSVVEEGDRDPDDTKDKVEDEEDDKDEPE